MRPNRFISAFMLILFILYSFVGFLSGAALVKLSPRSPRPKSPPRQKRSPARGRKYGHGQLASRDTEMLATLGIEQQRPVGVGVSVTTVDGKVKEIIAERLGVDVSEVHDWSSITDDLGADSLDQVELIMALEEEFDCEIPDEDTERLKIVSDFVNYVRTHCLVKVSASAGVSFPK